jgi:heme A synthase
MIAAAVSGFIVPDIMRHMVRDVPANGEQWKIVISGIFQINQAFARIYSVAASLAIILWSVSALRNGGLGRAVATYGCVIGPLVIIGIAIGHLRLDVHGMTVVAVAHAIWFLVVGAEMCRRGSGEVKGSSVVWTRCLISEPWIYRTVDLKVFGGSATHTPDSSGQCRQ